MTLGDLLAAWRSRLDDTIEDFLWPTSFGVDAANQAERESCIRANLIEDQTTAAVCEIAGVADTATYGLHAKILEVREVKWGAKFLDGVSREHLNREYRRGWEQWRGTPSRFIDPQEKYLTLVPKPAVDGDIRVGCYRLPLDDMAEMDDEPEIAEYHHIALVDWMVHLAYAVPDTELNDQPLSAKADADFTRYFGPRPDANTRRTQRARTDNRVVMNPGW